MLFLWRGGETEGDSVPLRSSPDSEAPSGRLIFTTFPRLDRHIILPVKPGSTFAERPYSIASLAVLLFRRGSAPPRTPPCQRNNIPLDSPFLPPPALFLIIKKQPQRSRCLFMAVNFIFSYMPELPQVQHSAEPLKPFPFSLYSSLSS